MLAPCKRGDFRARRIAFGRIFAKHNDLRIVAAYRGFERKSAERCKRAERLLARVRVRLAAPAARTQVFRVAPEISEAPPRITGAALGAECSSERVNLVLP